MAVWFHNSPQSKPISHEVTLVITDVTQKNGGKYICKGVDEDMHPFLAYCRVTIKGAAYSYICSIKKKQLILHFLNIIFKNQSINYELCHVLT